VKATKVNAGLAESNGRLLLGIWRDSLYVTCGLTSCTPGSAPGPTLGNEYGKTLPFYSNKTGSGSLRKCPHDHRLTDKAHLSATTVTDVSREFLPTRWRQKSSGLDIERNYATVSPCIQIKAMAHCRLRPSRGRHPLHGGARRRLGHDAASTTQHGRSPAHEDAMTSHAAAVSTSLRMCTLHMTSSIKPEVDNVS